MSEKCKQWRMNKRRRRELLAVCDRCAYCGRRLTFSASTLDHIRAVAWGGQHTPENTVLACKRCNTKKSCDPIEIFVCPWRSGRILFVWETDERNRAMKRIEFNYGALQGESRTLAKEAARKIHGLLERSSETIIEIGRHLIEVHDALGVHFNAWLKAEFRWSQSQASNFESVARKFGDVDCVSNFQPSALSVLCRNDIQPKAVTEAVRRAKSGEMITRKEAVQIIRRTAPAGKPRPGVLNEPINGFRSSLLRLARLLSEAERRQLGEELLECAMLLRRGLPLDGDVLKGGADRGPAADVDDETAITVASAPRGRKAREPQLAIA